MLLGEFIKNATEIPEEGSILAIDWGTVRLGLAFSDARRKIVIPLSIINNEEEKNTMDEIMKIIEEKDIKLVLIGMPHRTDGKSNKNIFRIEDFAARLSIRTEIPILFYNEMFTSKIAENRLIEAGKKTGKKDDISASILLEGFIIASKE